MSKFDRNRKRKIIQRLVALGVIASLSIFIIIKETSTVNVKGEMENKKNTEMTASSATSTDIAIATSTAIATDTAIPKRIPNMDGLLSKVNTTAVLSYFPALTKKIGTKIMSNGRIIDLTKPMVALTFDDGPYAPVSNRIMDCLDQYGGKVTFFLIGNRVALYPDVVNRMVQDGQEIGNHTYDHLYLDKLDANAILYQINNCVDAIKQVAGIEPKLVRLPGGNFNDIVKATVAYPMIMWSIDTDDWETRNAQTTISRVIGKVRDGDIVLMHEIYNQSGDAAVQIIPALVQQGFQLVTVSELAKCRGVTLAPCNLYFDFRPKN